ncbi:hypothetical protein [Nocardia caishijiensis]|uniref:YbaB/EbfC DNA-binding family protein n=1 Tax=Nocardia caishijiensis TaxID=184756 RepID=A0ABQ6YK37_9NOCA|nr:hypothetical protein [Nocardia caishijiensis]KAF0846018.1 hypothetical protein FNL39_106413 [Nocardia caishijiensis]
MSDIDPLTANVGHLQESLSAPADAPVDELVRLEVAQDGTIQSVQLSAAARAMTPDAVVAEVVRVHTAAVAASQAAISAAIAALEADPRLAALTEHKTDALSRPLPSPPPNAPLPDSRTTSFAPVREHPRDPAHSSPSAPPRTPAPRPSTPPLRRPVPPAPSPPTNQAPWPPPSREQPPTRSRQPTPEEEEEMDRYYGRKSWLEY